ncbi:DUF5672 family protein [Croceibacterium mercuriale]|uniref:DUF5672 family protein n=1 Tax=Croceibacterium mercuriale TaxID=1572751 RepID=UPI000AFB58D2
MSSVNIAATLAAVEACRRQIAFAACKVLTDANVPDVHREIEIVPIPAVRSSADYSDFLMTHLVDHVATPFCLVVQWDGHVVDAGRWEPGFLDYDYVGASWPQFDDGHDVGNGGFSLRSRRLMEACRAPGFVPAHPEDVAICRSNRAWLEGQGLRFAPREIADRFSAERAGNPAATFGYHGAWLMPRTLGAVRFWQLYRTLDETGSVAHDRWAIVAQVLRGPKGLRRAWRMLLDLSGRKQRGGGCVTNQGLQSE